MEPTGQAILNHINTINKLYSIGLKVVNDDSKNANPAEKVAGEEAGTEPRPE